MWVGAMAVFPGTLFQCATGSLAIKITTIGSVRSITFTDTTNGFSRQLSWTSGWVYLAVQRSGSRLNVFENGVSIFSNVMTDSTITYGGTTIIANNIIASVFDVRVLSRAVSSAAIAYYYDQIVNNGKQCPFLPILR
jgi:hypothetical protein